MANRSFERSSCVSKYLQEISEFPLLTKEEEHAIAVRMGEMVGKDGSYHDLVKSNLSFVVKIASEYKNMGLPFEDLLNEGNIGLIEAAHHFDPSRGTKFITYAIWWIRKSILKALSQHSAMVRIPNYQLKKVRNVRNTERMLAKELGREADREEISKELRVTIAKIDEILQMKLRELSLDDKVGKDKDTPISDYLVDGRSVNPEDELIKNESQVVIRMALRSLTDQEQTVIINRFGLEGGRVFTLKEIGEKLGVSRERVRQIENQAKKRLRKLIARQQRTDGLTAARNGRAHSDEIPAARMREKDTLSH
ncbi:MAG TPA: RNA polymerase sigma factor RpoD/SigA [Candidatus Polarisedimenticolia bacterium]|jgi:RNA polymerase primary sigma factor|nr:RNA polymerase sigma factor RpoD/SigA [Candidatus Polarisedimenticolia bacterium]